MSISVESILTVNSIMANSLYIKSYVFIFLSIYSLCVLDSKLNYLFKLKKTGKIFLNSLYPHILIEALMPLKIKSL